MISFRTCTYLRPLQILPLQELTQHNITISKLGIPHNVWFLYFNFFLSSVGNKNSSEEIVFITSAQNGMVMWLILHYFQGRNSSL